MHSYEDRIWAVELYYRYGKKTSAVVRELGYPSTKQLSRWVRIYEQKDDLPRDLKPRELLDRYIRWYNEKRIKLSLGGQFGYRKLLYYKGFPGMSTPVCKVSVCSSVKIKGRDCGTINGHDESSSIRTLMKDAREVLVR